MYVITAFSPTPGAASIAEYLSEDFFSDYIPTSISVIIAFGVEFDQLLLISIDGCYHYSYLVEADCARRSHH